MGGAGARRRLNPGGALSGRLLVALATSRLAMSFEGVMRNFPWVSRYVLVACARRVGFGREFRHDVVKGRHHMGVFVRSW